MAYSPVDLYRDVLPKTNCRDCGLLSCLAFAAKVVAEGLPLRECPHLDPDLVESIQQKLNAQYASGKWKKRDVAEDALIWARQRAASLRIEDLEKRIEGRLVDREGQKVLELPYFQDIIEISRSGLKKRDDTKLTRLEQVFLYNHLAQGGSREPSGTWKGFQELPNTVSKVKSMREHVEKPLIERFSGDLKALKTCGQSLGAIDTTEAFGSAEAALLFHPLPRVPVLLVFWDREEEFEAEVRLLFDETVTEHLDIESILFLSERLTELLCQESG